MAWNFNLRLGEHWIHSDSFLRGLGCQESNIYLEDSLFLIIIIENESSVYEIYLKKEGERRRDA